MKCCRGRSTKTQKTYPCSTKAIGAVTGDIAWTSYADFIVDSIAPTTEDWGFIPSATNGGEGGRLLSPIDGNLFLLEEEDNTELRDQKPRDTHYVRWFRAYDYIPLKID